MVPCLAALLASCGTLTPEEALKVLPAKEPWERHSTDVGILCDVEKEVGGYWSGFPPLPGSTICGDPNAIGAIASGAIHFLGGDYPNVPKSCVNAKTCEVPVLIIEQAGYCFAVLPFNRFPVFKRGASGTQPEQLSFVIASWDEQSKQWAKRPESDNFRFNVADTAPLFGAKAGVYIHELHQRASPRQAHVRKDLGFDCEADYFCKQTVDNSGLVATWTVGKKRTWRRPENLKENFIGRVYGGVMAAALVINKNKNAKSTFCKPVDPIIVNVAN